ncbi:YlxR family protein [Ornithinimicrobium pratense]|uniref:YlxR family protein n=1 Tax=Ornithinimicrobium pratense TaxID=2593973 RepID=A0A5J6V707_9MICO|nr:YlxR family protein [Ornithinimicrobium pratense]QFG68926.1 YlxR family protein [Ornithinimicrobium pratense]
MVNAVRTDPTPPRARHTPVRTCVGCRGRDEQTVLLRVVARRDGTTSRWTIEPDERRRGQGRGAYVHPDPACLQTAIARRAFGRALRLPAGSQPETHAVQERLAQQRA